MEPEYLNEISSEFFPLENSIYESDFSLNRIIEFDNIDTFFSKIYKTDLGLGIAIERKEKENFDQINFKSNFELNENGSWECERLVLNIPQNLPKHDMNINLFEDLENEKSLSNQKITENSDKKIRFLINKKKRYKRKKRNKSDSKKINYKRENNARRMIGSDFFNKFLLNLIKEMEKICNFYKKIEKFPKKFIMNAVKKENKDIINYTFEKIIENAESYKPKVATKKDVSSYLKIIEEIKSDKNKEILEKTGYDKYLKMNFSELFKEYLKSDVHEKKIEKLTSKKNEAEKFKDLSSVFIQEYFN